MTHDVQSYSLEDAQDLVIRCVHDGYRMNVISGNGEHDGWAFVYACPNCGHETVKILVKDRIFVKNLVNCQCAGCRAQSRG